MIKVSSRWFLVFPLFLIITSSFSQLSGTELDELRLLSSDASKWMAEMQMQEREKNNIPSLKVGYNRVFGYYLEVTKTHVICVEYNNIRRTYLCRCRDSTK